MPEDFVIVKPIVENILKNEAPRSVLEISGFNGCLGEFVSGRLRHSNAKQKKNKTARIDRVDLSDGKQPMISHLYDNIFYSSCLSDVSNIDSYDVIIIFHLFENLPADDAKVLLEDLLTRVNKQVLVITPIYPYDLSSEEGISGVRSYHPLFFIGLDFSYKLHTTEERELQIYSFFPSFNYEHLGCDTPAAFISRKKKLRIAYILPHNAMTGGVKALLQQMKELTAIGHQVNVYLRSDKDKKAIPEWSHLTDEDVSAQVVIPTDASFQNHLKNEDIIILGFTTLTPEFRDSKIPVVLWEQGSEALYGEYSELMFSNSSDRLYKHYCYRLPVHLLAVSQTIRDILKGVYNRESQFFPNGIDTDFYYPLKQKNNIVPVIMIVGSPALSFKGLTFALEVLSEISNLGVKFKVWWVSQTEFSLSNAQFGLEKFILPSQEKLAELYRNADIFLSTSLYESFPLPPIEAMASGTAVVSTDNGGINTYAKPGYNCLLCEQGDLNSLCFALSHLLLEPQARNSLALAGRETAMEYSFKNIVPVLEECLYRIISGAKE